MESIKIVQANADKEKVTVDVIRTVETKNRTTPEYLKEQRQKLVESIANFQASIDKIDATLENIYVEINKK
jgi:prefoldin subunit 5